MLCAILSLTSTFSTFTNTFHSFLDACQVSLDAIRFLLDAPPVLLDVRGRQAGLPVARSMFGFLGCFVSRVAFPFDDLPVSERPVSRRDPTVKVGELLGFLDRHVFSRQLKKPRRPLGDMQKAEAERHTTAAGGLVPAATDIFGRGVH